MSSESRTSRPLRIAQVAPLYERVPPPLYGGTERVVATLSDALVERGHDVVGCRARNQLVGPEVAAAGDEPPKPTDVGPGKKAISGPAKLEVDLDFGGYGK